MTFPPIPTIIDVVPGNARLLVYFEPIEIPEKLIWYQLSAYTGSNPNEGTIGTGNLSTFSFSNGSLVNGVTYNIKGRSWNTTNNLFSDWTDLWGTITPNLPQNIDYNSVVANSPATTEYIRNNLAFASDNATINETLINNFDAINNLKTSLIYKNNLSEISEINTLILPENPSNKSFSVDNIGYYYVPSINSETITINNPLGSFRFNQTNNDITLFTNSETQTFTNSEITNSTQIFSSNGQNVYIYGKGSLLFSVDCLVEGTYILTPNGYKCISELKNGDFLKTDDNRIVPIINIYKFSVQGNNKTFPILIPINAIGKEYPNKPIEISPNHAIKINNKWILAKNIKNSKMVKRNEIIYYHIELPNFETDNIVLEGNLVVESYGKNYNYKKIYGKNKLFIRQITKKYV